MPDSVRDQNIEDFDESYVQDVEEDSSVLDQRTDADDPVGFWERRQRDLVTSVLDYNLGTLSDLIQDKKIDLSPRYQRRFRWDHKRQSALIESFLMNVPIPPIFLNEDDYGQYSVIDGKQRLMAINEFMRGRLRLTGLKVFSDINRKSIDSLPPNLQNVITTRANLRAVIILRQSDPAVKFEVFQRLNTGGVRLNAQEIRNSTWPGPLNDLILELSEGQSFHKLLGIKDKERSGIYKEMRDAEFVLRFFTFRKNWRTFNGGMMRQMDTFMADNHHLEGAPLTRARNDFERTLVAVEAAFGRYAFNRWVPGNNYWRKQVLASLYDAEMFACRRRNPDDLRPKQKAILPELKKLFRNETFRSSIDAATNTPRLFRTRIEMMNDLLDRVVAG